jgi:hypothetical protein
MHIRDCLRKEHNANAQKVAGTSPEAENWHPGEECVPVRGIRKNPGPSCGIIMSGTPKTAERAGPRPRTLQCRAGQVISATIRFRPVTLFTQISERWAVMLDLANPVSVRKISFLWHFLLIPVRKSGKAGRSTLKYYPYGTVHIGLTKFSIIHMLFQMSMVQGNLGKTLRYLPSEDYNAIAAINNIAYILEDRYDFSYITGNPSSSFWSLSGTET